VLRGDVDFGFFNGQGNQPPAPLDDGANIRRLRLGVQGTFLKDFSYNFTWEFAPSVRQKFDGGTLNELQVAYSGLKWVTLRAGSFTLLHTLEASTSTFETLFLERASIVAVATSLASGDSRYAAGLEARGERWFLSAYASDGVSSTRDDDRQRGVVGRVVGLPFKGDFEMQVGFNGAAQFHPGLNTAAAQNFRLRDYPELRIDPTRALDTRTQLAGEGFAIGPEISGKIGKLHYAGEYQYVELDTDKFGRSGFSGWYLAAAYPLIGDGRLRSGSRASYGRPRFEDLNPNANTWGYLELAGRYSAIDRQNVASVALNYYPLRQLRWSLQYQNGQIKLDGPDRSFNAIGLRLAFAL
jgi:phosphate-selective porin OprO and OprP